MPKPCSLVETKGWNSRSRTKSAVMPWPRSTISTATSPPLSNRRSSTGASAGLASIAFWTRWASACSSAAGSRDGDQLGLAGDAHRMGAALLRRRARPASAGSATGRAGSASRAAPGERRASSSFIFFTELCSVAIMSARNSGLSAWRSALRATQAELADQILDVVHDEGEAAVELVEALGVGERVLALRLGDVAGGLDAGGAEQVEILPVERRGGSSDARGRRGRRGGRRGSAGCPPRRASSAASQSGHRKPRLALRPASRCGPPRSRSTKPLASTKRSSASAPSPAGTGVVQFQRAGGRQP